MTAPTKPRRYPDTTLGVVWLCFAVLFALFWAGSEAEHARNVPKTDEDPTLLFVGLAVGLLPSVGYWRGYRVVGMIPPGLTLLAGGTYWFMSVGHAPDAVAAITVFSFGLILGAIGRYSFRGFRGLRRPLFDRGFVPRWAEFGYATTILLGWASGVWCSHDPTVYPYPAAVGWVFLLAFAWVRLFRPFFELCVEPVLWLGYRIRAAGPGVDAVPYSGPLIVIANHACFWDPLFLAKVLPRPITPMMTAKYFDVWFLRPLMVYTFKVIRVSEVAVRRETPEVAEAVAALDRGECVVIFPEGYLRRKEDVPLRRFGRGVWEILKARPDTPVVAGWIEGGWGSCVSYRGGPPLKGKKIDIRRPIGVGLSAPVTVKAELLADHLRTRLHLMNAVSAARAHLGLDPLPPFELTHGGGDDEPAA